MVGPVKFERITAWAEVSDCGKYTVSAAKHASGYTFQAWRRAACTGAMAECLGTFTSAQPARDCCIEHARREVA
jgi:hypothetical protein